MIARTHSPYVAYYAFFASLFDLLVLVLVSLLFISLLLATFYLLFRVRAFFSLSVSGVPLCLSLSPSLSVYLSLTLCLSFSLSLSVSISLSLFLSLTISPYISSPLTFTLTLCFFLSLSLFYIHKFFSLLFSLFQVVDDEFYKVLDVPTNASTSEIKKGMENPL